MDDEQVRVLNFRAKIVSRDRTDLLRKFVVSFYLFDQTLQIYEEYVPNSSFRWGKFLQKTRVINPATRQFFQSGDFFVGQKITVAGVVFELLDASQLALGLMEADPDEFPHSDLALVISKFRDVLRATGEDIKALFANAPKAEGGLLDTDDAQAIILKFVPKLTRNAAMTLVRGFDRDGWYAYERRAVEVPEGLNKHTQLIYTHCNLYTRRASRKPKVDSLGNGQGV
jgi:hypothetical protein